MNLLDEDFSKLTARDLLLQQHDRQKALDERITRIEKELEKHKEGDFKELSIEVKSLITFRSENVGIWKTVTGISIILGIIATLIALLK